MDTLPQLILCVQCTTVQNKYLCKSTIKENITWTENRRKTSHRAKKYHTEKQIKLATKAFRK